MKVTQLQKQTPSDKPTFKPDICNFGSSTLQSWMLGESVERVLRMHEILTLVPGRVKTMTYKIGTCRFQAWHSVLIV